MSIPLDLLKLALYHARKRKELRRIMNMYAIIIALVLFLYGNCTFKIAWLRKTLNLSWGVYMVEAIAAIVTAVIIAFFALK